LIWNLENKKQIEEITCDVIDNGGNFEGIKKFISVKKGQVINDWLRNYYDKESIIGYLRFVGPDFQANSGVYFTSEPKQSDIKESRIQTITRKNLIEMSIYISVRFCLDFNWLNDRDQFLNPNDGWKSDAEFQNDCLAFALFHGQNRITSSEGTNHWIPFTEQEVNAQAKFESNFMTNFIKGKIKQEVATNDLFVIPTQEESHKVNQPLVFSEEATAVFDAGRELWKYYHAQHFPSFGGVAEGRGGYNANASLYDIREYFQGRNDKGRMNSKSDDATYTKLIAELRSKLAILADKIKPKVYEYGFLKE
jgi:hypothetical protein